MEQLSVPPIHTIIDPLPNAIESASSMARIVRTSVFIAETVSQAGLLIGVSGKRQPQILNGASHIIDPDERPLQVPPPYSDMQTTLP
jgi:hypothetical protein